MAAVIFFLLITTKIALSVLLVLAPFIVPMYMFPGPARDLCMGWARTLLTFMFIPILLYASCGLFVDVLEQHVEKIMADTANAESAFAYITITVICILFIRQVPSLAFGLTGGVSASDPGGSVYRGAKSALRGGGRLISKGLGLFKK
jgi:type IV secretory pathway VirB6-like protein